MVRAFRDSVLEAYYTLKSLYALTVGAPFYCLKDLRLRKKYGTEDTGLPLLVLAGVYDLVDWNKIPIVSSDSGILRHKDDWLRVRGYVENVSGLKWETTGAFGESYTHHEHGFSLVMEDENVLICDGIKDNQIMLHLATAKDKGEIVEVGGLFKDKKGRRFEGRDISQGYLHPWYFKCGDLVLEDKTIDKMSPFAKNARLTIEEAVLSTPFSP